MCMHPLSSLVANFGQIARAVSGSLLVAVGLTACDVEWGMPDDAEETEDRAELPERLQGAWAPLQCVFRSADGEDVWIKGKYVFTDDDLTWTSREYATSTCLEADLVIDYRGRYDVGDEIVAEDGQMAWEMDFVFDDIELIEGDTELPDEPYRRYDILLMRDDDTAFFLGRLEDGRDGEDEERRPVSVDFSVEYVKD